IKTFFVIYFDTKTKFLFIKLSIYIIILTVESKGGIYMSVKVVVGTQWGDEGKGKMVDYFAAKSDIIVRFQGGDNAGHTVINDKGVFKLHIVPCGVFEKDT